MSGVFNTILTLGIFSSSFGFLFNSEVYASDVELPVYGNWCGPGHPAKGETPLPVDTVDKACMLHDKKYTQCESDKNRLACEAEADLTLVENLRDDINLLNRTQLFVANRIGTFFVVQGTMKAITHISSELLGSRLEVATQLKQDADLALSSIRFQLEYLKEDFSRAAADTADQLQELIAEFKKQIENPSQPAGSQPGQEPHLNKAPWLDIEPSAK